MDKAVFLDRDGVINKLVFNPRTGEYESPHQVEDLELCPESPQALRKIAKMGFLLFLISNQPSYAKGKTSLENIKKIHEKFHRQLMAEKIKFTEYFYCYHHPEGTVPGFSIKCECRKPKPYFILKARDDYNLDLKGSWMIGDRGSDMACGRSAGLKTVLINEVNSAGKRQGILADFYARDLMDAVRILAQ